MRAHRSLSTILALWLGLFMAVLMPLHANSHCAPQHYLPAQTGSVATGGDPTDHPDLCSICKALSHLSLVQAEPGTVDITCPPVFFAAEADATVPSTTAYLISPRSPPFAGARTDSIHS
jgi:hypothetical protein